MSEHENYTPAQPADLKWLLGHVLLGPSVQTAGMTLSTIAILRDALDYLEARYARQIAEARKQQPEPLPPPRKKAATEAPRKRGRKPRANGQAPAAPPPLPFAGAEDPKPSEVPPAEL